MHSVRCLYALPQDVGPHQNSSCAACRRWSTVGYGYRALKGIFTIQRDEIANSQQHTLHEAAPLLEMSVDVLRKRAARGPLNDENDPYGTMHIRSYNNPTAMKHGATSNATATSPRELVGNLRSYIESLKSELAARNEELRRREEEHREQGLRKDHLPARRGGCVAGLEAPSAKPQNGRRGHVESADRSKEEAPLGNQEAQTGRHSLRWWQSLLGFWAPGVKEQGKRLFPKKN